MRSNIVSRSSQILMYALEPDFDFVGLAPPGFWPRDQASPTSIEHCFQFIQAEIFLLDHPDSYVAAMRSPSWY